MLLLSNDESLADLHACFSHSVLQSERKLQSLFHCVCVNSWHDDCLLFIGLECDIVLAEGEGIKVCEVILQSSCHILY